MVFAFAGPALTVRWSLLLARGRLLRGRLGLPAEDWVRALRARSGRGTSLVV